VPSSGAISSTVSLRSTTAEMSASMSVLPGIISNKYHELKPVDSDIGPT
jgi:hypothetical protein